MAADKNQNNKNSMSRRGFLKALFRGGILTGLGALGILSLPKASSGEKVWQLDPYKCIQCGQCAVNCILSPSAVKCVHAYGVCGYCDLCSGYYQPNTIRLDTAAENQLCPTKAIHRSYIEDPYYQYTIDEKLCIGCGKCVKGCSAFGNASLFLQVRQDVCVNCNECSIARRCPAEAFQRVPAESPYLFKGQD